MPLNYCGQKYSKLKSNALSAALLFVDDTFPANEKSLSSTAGKYGQIQWKRPKDICSISKFMTATVGDLSPGLHGNHMFVSACCSLFIYQQLLQKVVPSSAEQEWNNEVGAKKYAGIVHFFIWHNGQWQDVVVDDQLPTIDGELVFTHSPVSCDFWCSLLEKAYAKLLGSYEQVGEADMMEILEDFTGGLSEINTVLPDEDSQERLFRILTDEINKKTLISAIVSPTMLSMVGMLQVGGLLQGNGYCVIAVKRLKLTGTALVKLLQEERISLVRLRDPLAKAGWTGKFGHESQEWHACDEVLQKKLGITLDTNNDFWMTLDDFANTFKDLVMCRQMKDKYCAEMKSEWAHPSKAGGSIDNKSTFLCNPQFVFTVSGREDEVVISLLQNFEGISTTNVEDAQQMLDADNTKAVDDARQNVDTVNVNADVVENVQQNDDDVNTNDVEDMQQQNVDTINTKESTQPVKDKMWTIQASRTRHQFGFTVLKVEENRIYRLHRIMDVIKTSEFKSTRSVVMRHVFLKGRYVVVATLLQPNENGTFLLRIYTSIKSKAMELEQDKPKEAMCSKMCSFLSPCRSPTMVSQVMVLSASGFDTSKSEPNPYCIICCEGTKVMIAVCKNCANPQWNSGAIFYRRYPTAESIKIQLWNRNIVKDSIMGQVIIAARLPVDHEEADWPLYDKKDQTQRKSGYLRVRLTVSANMMSL